MPETDGFRGFKIAAAANILGAAAVTWRAGWSLRTLETLVALSAGFMISVTMVDILPEAIAARLKVGGDGVEGGEGAETGEGGDGEEGGDAEV